MRLQVTFGKPADGWRAVSPQEALDWLPADEPVDRIMVPDLFDLTGLELAQTVLEAWWSHPQVSVKTLLVVTCARPDIAHLVDSVRTAGWGIACLHSFERLAVDKWPIPTDMTGQVAGLCRAIKP